MGNFNVKVSFAIMVEAIKDKLERDSPIDQYVLISDELTEYVYSKLEEVDGKLYEKLKNKRKLKNDGTVYGMGQDSIKRLINEYHCSFFLFEVAGLYIFEDDWEKERFKFVKDQEILKKYDTKEQLTSIQEKINWSKWLKKIYNTQVNYTTIPIIGSDILGLNKLSMEEYFSELSYTPLKVLHQKEMLLYKEKQQVKEYKNFIESLQNDSFLTQKNFQDFNRILILGNPGTGKTIYSRWLCHQWAKKNILFKGIPIHIELKGVNFEDETPFFSYLSKEFERELDLVLEDYFLFQESIPKFFFILDGFDEISPDQQEKLLTLILETHKGTRFMLLSRPYAMLGHEENLNVDVIFEVLGFGKSSQKLYAERVLINNGYQSNSVEFWELISKHPFLSDFLPIPLTLSYLLILFMDQLRNGDNFLLTNINSTYTLQEEVLESLRRHFEEKVKGKGAEINQGIFFDKALVQGGSLAYSMEERLIFVINRSDPKLRYLGGYQCLSDLNKVGVGRLEFIEKKERKYLSRDRGARFSFVTATIQEYLAACAFTEEKKDIEEFLTFFSRNISWNFCKMVIGKYVHEGKLRLLIKLNDILKYNWLTYKNVNNTYRYLLFLGELDAPTINKFVQLNILETLFCNMMDTILQKLLWKNLFYAVFSKIMLKLQNSLKGQFLELYCAISDEYITSLIDLEFFEEDLVKKIDVLLDIGEISMFNQSKFFLSKVIHWIDKINSNVVRRERDAPNNEAILISYVGYFCNRYIAFLDECTFDMLSYIQGEMRNAFQPDKVWSTKTEVYIKTILNKREQPKSFSQLMKELLSHLDEGITINKLEEALQVLMQKIDIETVDSRSASQKEIQLCEVLISKIVTFFELDVFDKEPTPMTKKQLNLLFIILNKFYSKENYDLLYLIVCMGISNDSNAIYSSINYTPELDAFIADVVEKASGISPYEEKLLEFVCILKLLYHIQPGALLFSKHRTCLYEVLIELLKKEKASIIKNDELIEAGYAYYYKLVYRSDFLDTKFLVNNLLESDVCQYEYVEDTFLIPLLSSRVPTYEDKYWDYFFELLYKKKDAALFIEILNNGAIYTHKGNLHRLTKVWDWFYQNFSHQLDILIDDFYGLFKPIVNVLSFIERYYKTYVDGVLKILDIVGSILGRHKYQDVLNNLEEDDYAQNDIILAYLLILRFDKNNLNPHLKQYLHVEEYNRQDLYLFLIDLFITDDGIVYLQPYIDTDEYEVLSNLHSYYKDIIIDNNT